jgi:integrase
MGKRAELSGVQAKGTDRIQFDFWFAGVRYRPTLDRVPSEANLRRAHKQLLAIKQRIKDGEFNFDEEFPDYRFKDAVPSQERNSEKDKETCGEVFDKFLAHCEMRVSMDDMAFSTLDGYRDVLDVIFRPKIGAEPFEQVVYSRLAEIVAKHVKGKKKKTYNNVTSALRTAFKFGYKDRPGKFNPMLALPSFRITAKDRPRIDPFTIQEAETIITASHHMHGEWYGNYEEFGFFTGLRPSEQFALEMDDCDLTKGSITVSKAVVRSLKKNRTKTSQDREITLCPRALEVLRAQLALRERMIAGGKVRHTHVFFTAKGEPFETTYLPYNRWTEVMESVPVRYRKPYNSRHSYISWRLMLGHNRLLVALEDGHSVTTMEKTYAAWIQGTKIDDLEKIKAAMAGRPANHGDEVNGDHAAGTRSPLESPKAGTTLALEGHVDGVEAQGPASAATPTEDPSAWFCERKEREPCSRELAGAEGFEPPNGGIKTRCLTTWRRPNFR